MGKKWIAGAALVAVSGLGIAGTAAAAPTKAGTETFVITADFATGGGPVTASGVINATGTDTPVTPTEDLFDFGAAGTIEVFHSPIASQAKFSERTCTFRLNETGRYTFGNGTGDFAGYSGSGSYHAAGTATDACNGPTGSFTITAKGPIVPVGDN
jgi:hypothetical protein